MEWNQRVAKRQYLALMKHDALYCYLCGQLILSEKDFSFDHVFPRSLGGRQTPENMLPAHKKCNCEKGAMTLEQYRKHQQQRNRNEFQRGI